MLSEHFLEPGDGISAFWFHPGWGSEKALTFPVDRFFKRSFNGRNVGHRMWKVFQSYRLFRPDVIVTTDGYSYAVPAALLKRLGLLKCPLLFSYIGGDIMDCPEAGCGQRRNSRTTWLIRQTIRYGDVLRPMSPLLAQLLREDGADPRKIQVLPSHFSISTESVEQVRSQRTVVRREVRGRYRIPDTEPVVITLGQNSVGKGVQLLAEAWPRICARVPNIHWILAGPKTDLLRDRIMPLLAQHGVGASVVLTGRLRPADVFAHFAAADLHVAPSLCDGLPSVVIEATTAGTPSITTDGAGISAWIVRFEAGDVVSVGDVQALGDSIINAFAENKPAAWREKLVVMAEEFTMERVGAKLESIMQSLVQRHAAAESR
jgi:glycosyltransferase involved in cell wall biosynthesis